MTTALPFSASIAPSLSHGGPAARAVPVSASHAAAPISAPAERSTPANSPDGTAPPSGAQTPREHAAAGAPSRSTSSPRPASLRPRDTRERLFRGRELIRSAAEAGERILSYEVAMEIKLSEFYFARLFRAMFGRSPHVYYDEVRAERARAMLRDGVPEKEVARRIGFRRPSELRALLSRRGEQGDQDRAKEPAAAAVAAK